MSKDLQTLNGQNKLALWTGRISERRNSGMAVKSWCRENKVCEQTYYKWQRQLFEMAQIQQQVQFMEVTLTQSIHSGCVTVTIQLVGTEAELHSGADAATTEAVLRILKSCGSTSPE